MPPEFYPPELTDLSQRTMEAFLSEYPEAILIGGWASWLRLGTLLSHDIDVVLEAHVLQRARERVMVTESAHVGGRKYRAVVEGGIKLDIYVPYQSVLGQRLQLPVEALLPHAEILLGRRVLTVAAHLASKFAGLLDRPESNPGEKDRTEIWGLLQLGDASVEFASVLRGSRGTDVTGLVEEGFELLGDLELSRSDRQRLRALAKQYLAPVGAQT
ncbi:MAG: hypothetical protein ACYDGR_04885 [Candidatus Dormibacteria bacterium]